MNGAQFIVLSLGSCLLVFILQVKAEGQFNSICAIYLLVEVELLSMELIRLFGGSMHCSLYNFIYFLLFVFVQSTTILYITRCFYIQAILKLPLGNQVSDYLTLATFIAESICNLVLSCLYSRKWRDAWWRSNCRQWIWKHA